MPDMIEKALCSGYCKSIGLNFCDDSIIKHKLTNESLDAIAKGMDAKHGDRVLAICGSGMQAFALLESVDYIVAVDCHHNQAEYANYLRQLLKSEDYLGFLGLKNWNGGKINCSKLSPHSLGFLKYFLQMELGIYDSAIRSEIIESVQSSSRMRKISSKIDCLEIRLGNIFELDVREGQFNKIYLSNAIAHRMAPMSDKAYGDAMKKFSGALPHKGLVYISDREDSDMLKAAGKWPSRLEEDRYLTTIARNYQQKSFYNWKPKVFRKI